MASRVSRRDVLDQIEAIGVGCFWATDKDGRLSYLSPQGLSLLGKAADPIGKPLTEFFRDAHHEGGGKGQRTLGFQLRAHSKIENQVVEVVPDNGPPRWWRLYGRPLVDNRGRFHGYRGSSIDITPEYQRQLEAEQQSQYDVLTGLANRRRMAERLKSILDAYKLAKRSCALMMLDLDRFKQVNDTHGHAAGDELLKQVAQRLQAVVKDSGEIGRLGGDEFQVILPDMDDRGALADLAARIIQMLSQPYSLAGKRAIIGTSIGVAIAPYDGIESDELNIAADMSLYAAKSAGRGVYRFYSAELKEASANHHRIEEELRDALARGELQLSYQPLVDPKDNCVKAFEALMRWDHPELGNVNPGLFIPIAEKSDLIIKLGEWALRQACMDAAQWPDGLQVAVNVSARQFMNEDLPKVVVSALSKSGLDPSRLDLEITESVFVGDVEAVDKMFATLKKIGVRLSMDDFGTGYSSLGYLNRAPFDKIKIDQSFVRGCTESGNTNPAIISAIVALAQALGMETVAEGVEAMDELKLVCDRGASLVQGYIYSKPLTQDEVLRRLETGKLVFTPSGPPRYRADRKTLFRKVGLIHEDHYYTVMLRNLSKTGAWIEGLTGVPKGTTFVLDLGSGQLAVAKVARSKDAGQGLKFETELIEDGTDGLMTRHRVSPYELASAGMPLAALPSGYYPLADRMMQSKSPRAFTEIEVAREKVRLDASPGA
ncbi:MAG TPA: EAL domain-containing protein [Sphingomonadaceae bacterium]|nr:EAL domain-containing protein [Sphingomonadaceae bacterium]